MRIPVVLKDGKEYSVSKEELQHLIVAQRVIFFERSDGWTVLGRDKMRGSKKPYAGEDRRQQIKFKNELWY